MSRSTNYTGAMEGLNYISSRFQLNADQAIAHAQALATLALVDATNRSAEEVRTANLIGAAALAVAVDGPTVNVTADIAQIDARLNRKATQ